MKHRRPFVMTVAFVVASNSVCGDGARAQEILQSALGSAMNDQFGGSVAMGPDVDGDGFSDVAVGAPTVSATVPDAGAVYVLSGRDYSRMQTISGAIAYGVFGESVCWCGDVDGDGIADLAIGAPGEAPSSVGTVSIYSSGTWSLLRVLQGSSTFPDQFGTALADAGDVNADGVDDLLVGAPKANANGPDSGSMSVYSGSDGSLLWSIDGVAHSDLGGSLAAVGDLNGDGYVDIAVGEPWHDGKFANDYSGEVEVYSGKDRSVLRRWVGNSYYVYYSYYYVPIGDRLGIAVGAAGDFDGDGVPDVWVASYRGVTTGYAYVNVFSGATGKTLRTMVCRGEYQLDAAAIGDSDGDGLPEFVSVEGSFIHHWTGHVFVFSSIDGKILWETDDRDNAFEFTAVAGDPLATSDFLLGMSGNDDVGFEAGKVELRASNDLWLDVAPTHFPFPYPTLNLTAAEGKGGRIVALFLTGVNGAPMFNLLALAPYSSAGVAPLLSMTVPPYLSGDTVTVQAFSISHGKLIDTTEESITMR